MSRRKVDGPFTCTVGGRPVLVLTQHSSGSHVEHKPALRHLSGPDKERVASWLSEMHAPPIDHETAYQMLFKPASDG